MSIQITYFVHGTTTDNEKEISSGWYDAGLSELGMRQARELREQTKDKKFDAVFCSDLKRAVDSAKLAFEGEAPIIQDARLRECNYGTYNAKPSAIVEPMQEQCITERFPEGESYEAVKARIADFLEFLKKNYDGKSIAIVGHKAPQLALDVLLKHKTWEQAFAEDWRKTKSWRPGWEYGVGEIQFIKRKVIFFDCYQTLVDIDINEEYGHKENNQITAWEYVAKSLEEYGIRVGGAEFIEFNKKRRANFYAGKDKKIYHHNAGEILAQVLKEDLGVEIPEENICSLLFEYHKIARGYANLYPGVAETLARLAEKYTLAIASYTQGCYTQPELKELGIEKFFSYFVYSSDVGFRKTSPRFYERCVEIVGRKVGDCMMIGDNYGADVLVPQKLGIRAIWVKNPLTAGQYAHMFNQEPEGMIGLQEFVKLPEVIDKIWGI